MLRRALILTVSLILLLWVAHSFPNSLTLQKNGFYMVGAEGNTITLYGAECNAEINAESNTVLITHRLFTVFSETNGFPDVACKRKKVLIRNALETNVLKSLCGLDENALPRKVRCGHTTCKISKIATTRENNAWVASVWTIGVPNQICVNGKCMGYAQNADEFNIPIPEGNTTITIICGQKMDSKMVHIIGAEKNVQKEANSPENNTPVEINAPVEANVPEMNVEANMPKEANEAGEVNAPEANTPAEKNRAIGRTIKLAGIQIQIPETNEIIPHRDMIEVNEPVEINAEPLGYVKPYAIVGKRIIPLIGHVTLPRGKIRILTQAPPLKKNGNQYVIQSKKNVSIEVNADRFFVSPTNIPGAPAPLLAVFSFEKNVPAGGSITVKIAVPDATVRLWKFDGQNWKEIKFRYVNGWAEYNVTDNGPLDQDPTPGHIVDDVAVGTGGLTVSADLSPQIARPSDTVTVSGHVEKNGTAIANNWINIYLDGNRLGGPTYMAGPSDWWNQDWKYRREINITNNTGSTLSEYQVLVQMDLNALYQQGKLTRDARDLRFVDENGTSLDFWIEGVPTTKTFIPQSSDDTDPTTQDSDCGSNPAFKYYYTVDTDGSSGTSEAPSGWYTTDFNDADWNYGNGPFGNTGGECTTVFTTQPSDLFVRKWIFVPGDPINGELNIAVGGGVRCYVNGYLVIDKLDTNTDANYWNYTVELNSQVLQEGNNLLACWVALGGENGDDVNGYFDTALSVTYYERIQSDANIWVKVPSIPPGTSKIYVYYGNPAAQDVESYDNTFDTYDISKACSGSTAGGYCSVTFDPSSDLGGNYVFFRDQRYGYGTLDFLMSGDFDYGGAYADPTTCNTGGYERVAVYLNGNCYGTYSTGYQDCTDRRPATWPKDVRTLIEGQSSLTAEGDTDPQVNWDPNNCGYYYHFVWTLNAKLRKTASPEPTTSVGPEMMDTQTDGAGDYSWTFAAPSTIGEHNVSVDVNDGTDWTRVTVPLYVVGNLKIMWADTLPRVANGYQIYVVSTDQNINEVNAEIDDLNGTYTYNTSCTTSDNIVWLCDVNTYQIQNERYIIKVYGYDSGTLSGFDVKYAEGGDVKAEEFSTERDVNEASSVVITPYRITLQGILSGFKYRRPITIDNSSGPEYNALAVKIVVDTASLISAGKMKSDCSDVRFTDSDGATELNYWLERGCNTSSTVFWVKVPNIPEGGKKTIYMYYDNPRAPSASDGHGVFDFFDDFESWTGWTQYGSGVVSQTCSYSWDGSCALLKSTNNDPNGGYKDLGFELNYPFVLEAEVYRLNYSGGQWDRIGVIDNSGNGYGSLFDHGNVQGGIDVRTNYSASATKVSASANPYQEWYKQQLIWEGNGTIVANIYDNTGSQIAHASITDSSYSSFTRVYVFGGHDYIVDDIRIRPLIQNPPTAIVGSEESVPTVTSTSGGTWLGGYAGRDIITLDNTDGGELKDYQVKIVTNTKALIDAGELQSNCADIRFTDSDGTTLLPYWIKPGTCDTEKTEIWVKVPDIPAGEKKTIYMYYNNPSAAPASDGSKVFDFFDDFESWTGWTQYGSGTVEQSSAQAFDGSYSLLKTANNDPNGGYKDLGFELNYPFVLEAEVYRPSNYTGGSYDRIGVIDTNGNGYGFVYNHGGSQTGVDTRANYSGSADLGSASTNPMDRWYHAELIWNNGTITAAAAEENGDAIGTHTITDSSYSSFTRVYVFGGHDYYVDDLRIRKYTPNPPRVTIKTYSPVYAPSGYVVFKEVKPIKVAQWTYLDVNAENVRDTNTHITIYDANGTQLCSFDVTYGLTRYDISGCAGDANVIYVRLALSTKDGTVTPAVDWIDVRWREDARIKLTAPENVYQFRNEEMDVNGWLSPDVSGCNDVNAYLYFRTQGSPYTIEEYNYDQFSTRSYDANVAIGDDVHPEYLHPNLGYYVRPVTITNNSGSALSNYPVKITLDTKSLIDQGEMRSDCGDIRITDSNYSELNYWIVPGTCDTTNTKIWVLVPNIPTGDSTIYLFHGRLDYTSQSNPDAVFPNETTLSGECSGRTAGGSCTVDLITPSGTVVAPYQPAGYGELNMVMSGDFDYGGAYSNPTICDTGGYERAYFVLDNTWCLGTYTTGYQDCTDRTPQGWPIDVANLITDENDISVYAKVDNQVNYDPNSCGYYYHFAYTMKVKIRPKANPEPTVTVAANSHPDVAATAVYVSNALDTGETAPAWGSITWGGKEPTDTKVSVYVRTSDDGSNWTQWYEVQNGDTIPAPSKRYIEYNVVFYVGPNATDYPIFDNLKIVYYHGVPNYTLVTSTDLTLSTSDPNPYHCGAVAQNGECTPSWATVPKDRGEYVLQMRVTSDCGFEGNSNEKIVYVFAKTAITNLTTDKNVVARGDSFTLTGKVVDELGNPVARRPVLIYDDDTYIGETTTGDDGTFSFTYTVPELAPLGDHTIKAVFQRDGEEYYWESEASTIIKYSSRPKIENLAATPQRAGIGDDVNISATVTDEVGLSSVKADIVDPNGTEYVGDMNCNSSACTYDFNNTWIAGEYNVTIVATNLDGITSTASTTFTVEGHATFGIQTEKLTYGALEDVLAWNKEYWGDPMSTYSFDINAEGASGEDISVTTTVPTANDPFHSLRAFEFVRLDGSDANVSYESGVDGNAAIFAGNGSILVRAVPAVLTPKHGITIAAWVRMDGNAGDRYALALTDTSGNVIYGIYSPNGDTNVCGQVRVGGSIYSACTPALGEGSWHFIALSFDGETLRVYVDGSLGAYTALGSSGTIDYSNASPFLAIGAKISGGITDGWVGGIDELRIYNIALTDAQISDLYNGSAIKVVPVGYWSFNSGPEDSNPHKPLALAVNSETSTEENVTVRVPFIGVQDSVTVSGAASVEGKEGNAAAFDGSASITYSGSDLTDFTTFSAAAWIYPEANGGVIINKGYNNSPSWEISLTSTGNVRCTLRDASGNDYNVDSTSTVPANQWTHVACTYDGRYLRVYVNGAEEGITYVGYLGALSNTSDLVVGSGFVGSIDDLRVYRYALSSKDIANLYSGENVRWGLVLAQSFDTNNWNDEANDWTVTLYSGGWPRSGDEDATAGESSATVSGEVLRVWKRAAICNTGDTNVAGYLYVDVQAGAGDTWSTVPPVTINDAASGTKRTIAPGTCLDLASIYNANPWNTEDNPAGTYRLRMAFLKPGGSPGNADDYITTTDGQKITDTSEFNIVAATLAVSDINHTNLALYNLNEYETTDDINWIDVYVTARSSTALDTNVTLTLTDEYKAYAGFGPNNETKYYGTIPKDGNVVKRWDNGGSGYYIPADVTAGTYEFHWLVEMNAANGPTQEDFTRFVVIHNLPSEFNSSVPTRIYYYDDHNNSVLYEFCMKNPWSRELNNVSVKINCPSGVGLVCEGVNSGTDTESLANLASGASACFDFNIIATPSSVSGDYDINVGVTYTNPAGNVKNWKDMQNHVLEVRKAGILEIILTSYDQNAIRGENNVSFISKAHNTGTVNDENAWIAYGFPSDWTVASKSTDGTWGSGDVNAFKSLVAPDGNIELNVTFGIPADANKGPQLVHIATYTATNPEWNDFKNVYVTIWDRPELNLSANDYNASVGEKITLYMHLTDSLGNPLANQRINIDKNGTPLGAADTNSDGWATYVWDLRSESPGTYTVTATYDQNDTIYEIGTSDSITVNIGLPPEINADATPKNVGYGLDVTIDANATDDQGIKSVWATVQKPDGNEFNVSMSNVGGNEYRGTFQPWEEGNYTLYVYAEDLYDSVSQAGPITVTAEANAEMGIETDKNFYLQGELVKLKSPAWWNINWKYRMPIVVKNPSTSSDMNDYPVRIELNTEKLIDEGHLRWDAGDLRFVTEDGTELNYWFQSVVESRIIIPRASDDTNPTTQDSDCTLNPTYKYFACDHPCNPTGWYATDYDDSSWPEGYAPFGGNGGQCTDALTSAPDDLFTRKWFYINGKPLDVNLYVSSDEGAECYVNGQKVIDDISSTHDANYWNYEVNITAYVHEGNNLLACWVANGGENNGSGTGYFDAEVYAKYERFSLPDANVWVKVPYVPKDSNVTIYMYYGNPDATSESNAENVFTKYNATLDCSGSDAGGSCSVTFLGSGSGYIFAPYQKGSTLDFLMSGDFDQGGAYADPTSCTEDSSNERAAVYLNGVCFGTYTTGYQDCTDRRPATWPKDIGSFIADKNALTATGDAFPQVNYDPNCGYYYHFVWTLNAYVRPYIGVDANATVGPEKTIGGSYIIPGRDFKGYLLGIIERNTDSGWTYVDTDLNDLASGTERTFTADTLFDLSSIWNDWNTYGQPQGTYRARIIVAGPDGNALTYNGQPIEEYNVFQIGPPPVDVNISAFRVYDVNGVADPRTEGNLVDSGLEKTIYVSADRKYRMEFDVTVGTTSNDWNIADSNVWFGELNSAWNVLDFWYTLPDGTDKNGGSFDGNVHWDTNNDGTAGQSQTVTFHFIVDLNTMHAEEHNATITVTHPAFIKRTDWVDIKTYVPDVIPPAAVEYNLLNLETNQMGWEINAIRSFQNVKIFAEWNEDISKAYVEYNGTSSTLTTADITPDGNYTEYNFTITSFWLLGPHVAKIHAADLSGNWNDDLNFLTFYVWGLARVSSMDLNDNNVYIGDPVEINCTVVDATDSDNPIDNYPVKFWDNGTLIGTAYTDSNGVASITWTPSSYGSHTLECNVDVNAERWYQIDPPNNEKNTTIFIKESVPPSWNDANAPTKVHRGEVFDTNVHWWDNDKIETVSLHVEENGGAFQEVNSVTVDANDVYVAVSWKVPADANLGPAQWYQEANDPSGNITDTNTYDFNIWGWAYVSDSYINPTGIAPGGDVNAYCQVKDYTAGTAIDGYVVHFEINGTYLGDAETNADGWARYEFTAPSTTGQYDITCWIDANAERFYDPYPDKNSATEILNVTTSSDTTPPYAVNWELNDMNRTQVNVAGDTTGQDINVIRGDDINFWAVWDENLSKANIETNVDATTTADFNTTIDGNYAEGIIETNAAWARGVHYARMTAQDLAGNPSTDANSANATYTVYAQSDVQWIEPKGTVSQKEYNLLCKVYEDDTNAPIGNYAVQFYDNQNGYLGTADTNADGYASLEVNFANYDYGSYYFWCQISDWPAEYYKAKTDQDGTTISVSAINLKATTITTSEDSNNVKEGDIVTVDGNVWNQYDPVDANVDILVQKWNGSEWNTVDQNRYTHSFGSDENATFTYTWTAYPGRYRFVIVADPNNTIDEENEADNNAWVELNVPTWATLYGDVNGLDVLGSSTYYFYTWSGTGNGVVIFYDADINDLNVDALQPMTTEAELNEADYTLGTNGNPDCILCKYDQDGDGKIDNWHVFDIEGREINAPVFYVENWPVGILYDNNNGASSFDGTQPIVFVTEIYNNQACSESNTGVCDYVADIPSPLKRQFGTTDKIKIQVVR